MKLNYFNYKELNNEILMTNDMGQFVFLTNEDFKNVISGKINKESQVYGELFEKNMIYDCSDFEFSSRNKHELRWVKGHVNSATSLQIFVVTTACNMGCLYCQANSGDSHIPIYMTKEIAEKSVDIALQSPATGMDFEFQGGEPLLNFDIVKHIVEYTEANKGEKHIRYNIVTNLTLVTDEILDFFEKYNVSISTSLDGCEELHNYNRPFVNGNGTFEKVKSAIEKIRERGLSLGAIQTTTRKSLHYAKELVHTYLELGFDNLFIRPLTPLGKAAKCWTELGYTPEEFLIFYSQVLEEMIRINKSGIYMKENHAAILLRRINGDSVNYMELRSPCGAGIGQMAFYADGNIFTCDEGRMISEMGDNTFCLGNVFEATYNDLIKNGVCKTVCASSILETVPSCCDCVYQPYCGTCPVVNYALYKDVMEKSPNGYRCKIYKGILDLIFQKYQEKDIDNIEVLNSWSN